MSDACDSKNRQNEYVKARAISLVFIKMYLKYCDKNTGYRPRNILIQDWREASVKILTYWISKERMFREAYGIVTCKVIVMVKEVKLLRSTP
jgi:hypothetical protein